MKHLHDRSVLIPVELRKLYSRSKTATLKYLMFLQMKQDGRVKGRGFTDVRSQHAYTDKDENSSPKVATESLMILCVIDSMERRAVATLDIQGAFLQADMDELVYVKFEELMTKLLSKIYPKLYEKYVVIELVQTVLYAALAHLLHGTLQASLLLCRKLTGILVDSGYKINPYDWCMASKEFNGGHCTVLWHIDDLKWSHLIDDVMTVEIEIMNKLFGSKDAPLTVCRGKIHDYLVMALDYSLHEKEKITMFEYIEGFLSKIPSPLKGDSVTDAPNHLFEVRDDAPMLQPTDAKIYYHYVV